MKLSRAYFGGVEDAAVPGVYGGGGAAQIAVFRPTLNGL